MNEKLQEGRDRAIDRAIVDSFMDPTNAPLTDGTGLTLEKLRRARDILMRQDEAPLQEFEAPEAYFVHWRFPRSKKRRIRKKWGLDPRNWRLVWLTESEARKRFRVTGWDDRGNVWGVDR